MNVNKKDDLRQHYTVKDNDVISFMGIMPSTMGKICIHVCPSDVTDDM